MKRNYVIAVLAIFAATLSALWGCADKPTDSNATGRVGGVATCGTTSFDLIAGQTTVVGQVTVNNDGQNLYLRYSLDYTGACFGNLHLWVGKSRTDLPGSNNGTKRPSPGQFCGKPGGRCFNATSLTEYTFTIPLSEIGVEFPRDCNTSIYVVAHAEVDMDCNPATPGHETAFGGGIGGPGSAWWFYGRYSLCCNFNGGGDCEGETGWGGSSPGGGNAWWYYFNTAGNPCQPIYAGQQLMTGGQVCYNSTTGKLDITLGPGWSLRNVSEPVKIQGYQAIPASRPAAGQFTTYKGTALTDIPVGTGYAFYAIHLDVQYCED